MDVSSFHTAKRRGGACGCVILVGIVALASSLSLFVTRAGQATTPIGIGKHATVFLIASTIFALQATISLGCHFVATLHSPQFASLQLQAFCSGVQRFMALSIIGSLVYAFLYASDLAQQLLIAWLPDGGPHFIIRNLYWLLTTPVQWNSFAHACTCASNRQIDQLIMYTVLMQVFGLLMLLMTNVFGVTACYVTSCVFFILMFRQAFALPLLPDLLKISSSLLYADLVVWSAYPIATVFRLLGYIDVSTEQVYIFTLLDVASKSATFTTILATHLLMVLTNIDCAVRSLKDQQNAQINRLVAEGYPHDA